MASRNSFLDSPNFRRITTPTQRRAVESRRRSSGFRGGSGGSSIRRETPAERQQRERQERLKSFQSELSDSGTRLTASERDAIIAGEDVSSVRERVVSRQRREGFASLQRDLSRSGTRLTPEEARLIAEGNADPFEVRQQVESRRGRQFASQQDSFVTAGDTRIRTSEAFSARVREEVDTGRLQSAQESINRSRRVRATQEFASQAGLGGASFVDGDVRAVTPSGESVGGASTTEFASFVGGRREPSRLVTPSGRDVTPTRNIDVGGVVSARSRTPFASRRGVQSIAGGRSEAQAVGDFVGGVGNALFLPGSAANEVFQFTDQGRINALDSTPARAAGQTVGLAGSVRVLAGGVQGASFVGGVFSQSARRTAARLGLRTASQRAAATSVAAPIIGAGLLAPEVIQSTFQVSTGRSSLGSEALEFGINRATEFGAGAILRRTRGVSRSFRSGASLSEGSQGFTRQGVLSGRDVSSVLDDAVAPVNPSFIDSDVLVVRSGRTPLRTSFRSGNEQNTFLTEFSFRSGAQRTGSVSADGSIQSTFSFRSPQENRLVGDVISQDGFVINSARVGSTVRTGGLVTTDASFLIAGSDRARQSFTLSNNALVPITFSQELALLSSRRSGRVVTQFDVRDVPSPLTMDQADLTRELVFRRYFDRDPGLTRDSFFSALPSRREPASSFSGVGVSQAPSTISISQLLPERQVVRISDDGLASLGVTGGDLGFGNPRFSSRSRSGLSAQQLIDTALLPPSPPTPNLLFSDFTGGLASSFIRPTGSFGRLSRSGAPPRTRLGATPSTASSVRSRARFGLDDFAGFVPRVDSGVSSRLSQSQTPALAQGGRSQSAFDLLRGVDSGFRIRSGLDASQRISSDVALDTDQLITQDLGFPRIGTPPPVRRPGRPRDPPPPRRPRVPDLDLPQLNFGTTRRQPQRSRRNKRREEFTPSVVANFLGLTGRRSSVSTGIEIRPIQL